MFGKLGRQMFGTGKRRTPHDNHKKINKYLGSYRILVLGPDQSGIATIFHSRTSQGEIQVVAPSVRVAVVEYIKMLCFQSKSVDKTDDKNTKGKEVNESLRQEILTLDAPYELNAVLASKIAVLWADHAMKETLRLRFKFPISENVEYLLDRIMVIG
eukprot:41912_1